MNVISRGVRNAFRNTIRTVSVVLILALSIGLALAMLMARGAVDTKIKQVRASIGNTIAISPAGARGFMGGGEPLTADQIAKVKALPHVASVASTLQDRLTTTNSNLTSAIAAGTLGRRFNANTGGGGDSAPPVGGATDQTRSFTPPVLLIGASSLVGNVLEGGNNLTLTAGQTFNPDVDAPVALVGKTLADKNHLSVGGTFQAYGSSVTVSGIYDAGTSFANNSVVMPLGAVQRLSGQAGQLTSATATVDDAANVEAVTTAIESALGSDVADVTNSLATVESALAPLQNIKTISTYSLMGALVAGAVIILLTMMMIVRERRREIGILKAIGSSNLKVVVQFMAEAVTFTLLAVVIGLGLGVAAGGPVTHLLASSSADSVQTDNPPAGGPGNFRGGGRFGTVGRGFGRATRLGTQSLQDLRTAAGVDTLLAGLGTALFIALVGSAIPALLIAKISPAEVMRAE